MAAGGSSHPASATPAYPQRYQHPQHYQHPSVTNTHAWRPLPGAAARWRWQSEPCGSGHNAGLGRVSCEEHPVSPPNERHSLAGHWHLAQQIQTCLRLHTPLHGQADEIHSPRLLHPHFLLGLNGVREKVARKGACRDDVPAVLQQAIQRAGCVYVRLVQQ